MFTPRWFFLKLLYRCLQQILCSYCAQLSTKAWTNPCQEQQFITNIEHIYLKKNNSTNSQATSSHFNTYIFLTWYESPSLAITYVSKQQIHKPNLEVLAFNLYLYKCKREVLIIGVFGNCTNQLTSCLGLQIACIQSNDWPTYSQKSPFATFQRYI